MLNNTVFFTILLNMIGAGVYLYKQRDKKVAKSKNHLATTDLSYIKDCAYVYPSGK